MKGISAVQRSLKRLRDDGAIAAVVEKWNPHARIRQDMFGVFDLVAIRTGDSPGIVGIQVKSDGDGAADAKRKMDESAAAKAWQEAGGHVEIWVWRKVKPRGVKVVRWKLRRITGLVSTAGFSWWEVPNGEDE